MDSSVNLAEQWITFRKRAGLISARSARTHSSQLDYFMKCHPGPGLRVDRRSIRKWLESIGHLSTNTRRNHLSTVRTFLAWAAAEGLVNVKVVALVPKVRQPRTVPRALNVAQIHTLLGAVTDVRLRAIVGLMLWCGLRCAEVSALRMEDVDEHAGTIFVRGKGGHQRIVCIPPELVPSLTRWLDQRNRLPGAFITGRWGHLQPQTVSAMVVAAMAEAGLKTGPFDGRSAHALRHTAASDVLERGASISTVQALLGHANVSTTSIYLRRARLEDLRLAMAGRSYGATPSPPPKPSDHSPEVLRYALEGIASE